MPHITLTNYAIRTPSVSRHPIKLNLPGLRAAVARIRQTQEAETPTVCVQPSNHYHSI